MKQKSLLIFLPILLLSLVALSWGVQEAPATERMYRNPIEVPTDGREIADPSVYKYKDRFYLLSTQIYSHNGAGFRVWVSDNLVEWKFHRNVPVKGKAGPMMAPDLVYHEGTYYLYWSADNPAHDPKGIHLAAKYTPQGSDFDPFGPSAEYKIFAYDFLKTRHHNIDGEIFFNGNDPYMFFCGHGGIRYKKLLSLEEAGNGSIHQLTSCVVDGIDIKSGETGNNGWTEAPAIFLLDGYYHLTYSGIHFLRPDYQIHSARGRSIETIKPYKPNPLICRIDGEVNGMGNNNWIIGPDLKTRYTTYHAKIGAGVFNPSTQTGFMRKLMLDRYEVDPENGITTDAPTLADQPIPSPVGWAADPANRPNSFINTTGTVSQLLAQNPSGASFVVEGHVKGSKGVAGIMAGNGKIRFAVEAPTSSPARLKYYLEEKGWVDMGIENINAAVWHKLKIDKNGKAIRFYYDGRFVGEDVCNLSKGGELGYFTENPEAGFSWLGFSNY